MTTATTAITKKTMALSAAGLVVAGALLAGCGEPKATPMDDEYSGNSGETAQSQEQQSQSDSDSDSAASEDNGSSDTTTSDKQDTGNYADGTYSINGQYGPIGEDTIDVHITIKDGNVDNVEVIGHPFTTISKGHQDAFAEAINGVVDGKPLKGLSVDKVAGASWTSDAFNKALEVARQEASIPAGS
ncbi:FMN-binding protein [Bifidobacterium oedipodis]|uniref:FMN-binding protein n=1 Tax=Bifidobacterium oedipodis TaxID=2675322 RepID=A0A7Y0EQF7_9BIFI|nr:FMN-binding protein [Bifidobacterium sp. DSM 109957]NMM93446.1 FMN-binding protein [Bifidobacterium sp. DSM 109957]